MTVDAERLLSGWLRGQASVTALVADRVYTELPTQPTFPLVRITLTGGRPYAETWQPNLTHDAAVIQIDAYGGPKVLARQLLDVVRSAIAVNLPGHHALGVVTGSRFGEVAYVPDSTFNPPKPRYTGEVTIYTHP